MSLLLLLRVREGVCEGAREGVREGVVNALLVTKRAKKRTSGRKVIGNILKKYFDTEALDENFMFSWLRKIVRVKSHGIMMGIS